MVEGVRVCKPGLVYPQRSYVRPRAAVGVIEMDGAVPFTVAAKCILQEFPSIAMLRPFLLGSATGALAFAGDVADVKSATDRKWLIQEEVLGRFYKRKPLLGTVCFENPSSALWEVMQDIEPMERPSIDLIGDRLTLVIFETLLIGPFLEALEFIGRREGLNYIGSMNFGSKHKSLFYAGEQDVAEEAKWEAKKFIRALMDAKQVEGEYDGSWFLNLGEPHHDLIFLLPWNSNPRPFSDALGRNSYLVVETQGLVAFFKAVNRAAWKASVVAIAPRELGSGTETAILTSPEEDAINDAASEVRLVDAYGRNLKGDQTVLNIRVFHHPKEMFGRHMTGIVSAQPRFEMAGMSVGLVDVRDRGGLYDAVHELRKHPETHYIGMRKIGSRRAFMAFAGPQDAVEAALEDIKERAEAELVKPGRCGELYNLGVIENPNEQILRLLPWQKPSLYYGVVPEGKVLSNPYYEPGQPFAFVETLGMTHGFVIANKLLHEGVVPVSIYGVGSGLKVFHFASDDYDLLRQLTDWKFLKDDVCAGMPYTADARDGLDRMLVNVASYSKPGPIWEMVDHQQPVPGEIYQRLLAKDVAVGVITLRGMSPTLYFLDRLKNYGVKLWGIQKSGGLHMTAVIYGPLGQVRNAIEDLSSKMALLHEQELTIELEHLKEDDKLRKYKMQELYGWARTWAVIGNPHPNLVFFLPRGIRVGV